ncbi:histidine kinase [Cellulomonas sp. NPDC089187]|uniref:sensor histidine kinase n=1 Tax=Cellulomonas sp. NPDC089187 TaxID=3154970 RepID=UPI003412CDFC
MFFALGTALIQAADTGAWLVLFSLAALAIASTILFRRTRPVAATVAAAVGTLLLPLDNLAVLICLPWVIASRPARTARWVGALATVAVIVALVRDFLLDPSHSLFSSVDEVTGEHTEWPAPTFLAIGLFVLTMSIGSGLLRRNRHNVEQAQSVQRQLRAELTTELGRQDERDLIARELHDTVAHHLSVVSLRAAALEVSGDTSVQEAAESVRSSTHQALEEMRDLIGVLRTGQMSLTAGPGPGRTLTELPELIATARESGADVAANVFITGSEDAPPALTRAVYRIVQESLTNAIKHAPRGRIDLDLRAGPGLGVHLRVVNPLPPSPVGAPGSGTGLLGVRERVAAVGGTVEAGPQCENWVLTAHLPWPAAD